jgi:hypothetical protein
VAALMQHAGLNSLADAACAWTACLDQRASYASIVRPGKAPERLPVCSRHAMVAVRDPAAALRAWQAWVGTATPIRQHIDPVLKGRLIEEIRRRPGISRFSLYRYHAKRDEVLAALDQLVRERAIRQRALPAAAASDNRAAIDAVYFADVDVAEDRPDSRELTAREAVADIIANPDEPCARPGCSNLRGTRPKYCSRECGALVARAAFVARNPRRSSPPKKPTPSPAKEPAMAFQSGPTEDTARIRNRLLEVIILTPGLAGTEYARRTGLVDAATDVRGWVRYHFSALEGGGLVRRDGERNQTRWFPTTKGKESVGGVHVPVIESPPAPTAEGASIAEIRRASWPEATDNDPHEDFPPSSFELPGLVEEMGRGQVPVIEVPGFTVGTLDADGAVALEPLVLEPNPYARLDIVRELFGIGEDEDAVDAVAEMARIVLPRRLGDEPLTVTTRRILAERDHAAERLGQVEADLAAANEQLANRLKLLDEVGAALGVSSGLVESAQRVVAERDMVQAVGRLLQDRLDAIRAVLGIKDNDDDAPTTLDAVTRLKVARDDLQKKLVATLNDLATTEAAVEQWKARLELAGGGPAKSMDGAVCAVESRVEKLCEMVAEEAGSNRKVYEVIRNDSSAWPPEGMPLHVAVARTIDRHVQRAKAAEDQVAALELGSNRLNTLVFEPPSTRTDIDLAHLRGWAAGAVAVADVVREWTDATPTRDRADLLRDVLAAIAKGLAAPTVTRG